jgi:hypothetical protein
MPISLHCTYFKFPYLNECVRAKTLIPLSAELSC